MHSVKYPSVCPPLDQLSRGQLKASPPFLQWFLYPTLYPAPFVGSRPSYGHSGVPSL